MTSRTPNNAEGFHECVINSDPRETVAPKEAVLELLRQRGFSEEAVFAFKLALEEALCNAVKHGNQCDPSKSVTIRYRVTAEKAEISVRDEGPGFKPEEVPDPTSQDRLPLPNGRGIMLMRAYMDEVVFRDNGREVCFTKYRK